MVRKIFSKPPMNVEQDIRDQLPLEHQDALKGTSIAAIIEPTKVEYDDAGLTVGERNSFENYLQTQLGLTEEV